MERTPYELTALAVTNQELDKLLLGLPPYEFRPKFSPSSTSTDLAILLPSGLYEFARRHPSENLSNILQKTLLELADTYEGIPAVASIILGETRGQFSGETPLKLDLHALAKVLSETINKHKETLRLDNSGEGWSWKDGRLGDLRNLSKNTVGLGGMGFCV